MELKYSIDLNDTQIKLLSILKAPNNLGIGYFHIKVDNIGIFLNHFQLDWPVSKLKRVVKSLFGVMAVYEFPIMKENIPNNVKYVEYAVPEQNHYAVDQALNICKFEKEIKEKDIPILKLIYERDKEFKKRHGNRWNPRFDNKEISEKADVEEHSSIASLERLTGVLAQAYTIHWKTICGHERALVVDNNRPEWFLSNQRIPDAKKVLGYA